MVKKSPLTSKIESEIALLQRHVAMLKAIMENEPIGIIKLSEMLRFPQHKVRCEGALTTDKLQGFLDHLKDILDSMSDTVKVLKKTLD
jgi:predicted transcriptional regulator